MEILNEFITIPTLKEVITYALLIVFALFQYLLNKGLKKDNLLTQIFVDKKTTELKDEEKALKKAINEQAVNEKVCKEIETLKTENYELKKSLKSIENSLMLLANGSKELVLNGTAVEIQKKITEKEGK